MTVTDTLKESMGKGQKPKQSCKNNISIESFSTYMYTHTVRHCENNTYYLPLTPVLLTQIFVYCKKLCIFAYYRTIVIST